MDKLSPYDQMLNTEGWEDNLALKQLVVAMRSALEKGGVKVDPSADAAQVDISKGDLHVRVKVNETEMPRVKHLPFVFMHMKLDPWHKHSPPEQDFPGKYIHDASVPFVLKDANDVKEELSRLFLGGVPFSEVEISRTEKKYPLVEGPRVNISAGDIGNKLKFEGKFFKLGESERLKDLCKRNATVTIRIKGGDEGHARARVRIEQIEEKTDGSLWAKMKFIEPAPIES